MDPDLKLTIKKNLKDIKKHITAIYDQFDNDRITYEYLSVK
jgi:hypothetical protein